MWFEREDSGIGLGKNSDLHLALNRQFQAIEYPDEGVKSGIRAAVKRKGPEWAVSSRSATNDPRFCQVMLTFVEFEWPGMVSSGRSRLCSVQK